MGMWMRRCLISMRGLTYPGGILKAGTCSLLVIVTASYGRGPALGGDVHEDSGLSTRAIAVAVTQKHRKVAVISFEFVHSYPIAFHTSLPVLGLRLFIDNFDIPMLQFLHDASRDLVEMRIELFAFSWIITS
ncbi:hypothetical protein AVEN_89996-1 [Araneus ventricosus]|uniref:Uncharacterized protein n=1 Tax=Araneus ventricosus TaxID=182803 RepID=A0A4Y2DBV4_ARAVE|nr:hypothetical protein AVEN_89996-1 [Araneus ventricosus]